MEVKNNQYTPSHIANFFLAKEDHDITNLKLNKIVYIAVGYALAIANTPLFSEEIQAWKYGPVIPSLYYEFQDCKKLIITRKSNAFMVDKKEQYPHVNDKQTKRILELVYNHYKSKKGGKLIDLTHKENTPYSLFYVPMENNIIKKTVIKKYYKALLDI